MGIVLPQFRMAVWWKARTHSRYRRSTRLATPIQLPPAMPGQSRSSLRPCHAQRSRSQPPQTHGSIRAASHRTRAVNQFSESRLCRAAITGHWSTLICRGFPRIAPSSRQPCVCTPPHQRQGAPCVHCVSLAAGPRTVSPGTTSPRPIALLQRPTPGAVIANGT